MTRFSVQCGMRPSSRFPAMTDKSTIFRTVTVEAKDADEARHEAIDECYRQWGNAIEHVKPLKVAVEEQS
jgi:hypothetical protein